MTSETAPNDAARSTPGFRVVRRGFEPAEVSSVLGRLQSELSALRAERDSLAGELKILRSGELDEAEMVERLGEETTRVLRSAHQAARQVRARAEADAEEIMADALAAAENARSEAASVLATRAEAADAKAAEILREAHAQAKRIVQEAERRGSEMLAEAALRYDEAAKAVGFASEARLRLLDSFRHATALIGEAESALLAEQIPPPPGMGIPVGSGDGAIGSPNAASRDVAVSPAVLDSEEREDSGGMSNSADVEFALRPRGHLGPEEGGGQQAPGPKGDDGSDLSAQPTLAPAATPDEAGSAASDRLYDGIRAARQGRRQPQPSRSRPEGQKPSAPAHATAEPESAKPATVGNAESAARPGAWIVSSAVARPAVWPELMEPVVQALSRRLKRAGQDRQNAWLDTLRQSNKEGIAAKELLGDDKHYQGAVSAVIAKGWETALAAWGGDRPAITRRTESVDAVVASLASRTAAEVVEAAGQNAHFANSAEGTDALSGAFREWRNRYLAPAVADTVLEVFASAFIASMPQGMRLRWVANEGSTCPECTSNAVVAPRVAGDPFPTGHRHPPAHRGCRCVLLPLPT